jgi:hypothetical protein
MKGIDSTGVPLVHVPGWMDGWMGGWMNGRESRVKDCLQQSKISIQLYKLNNNSKHNNYWLSLNSNAF